MNIKATDERPDYIIIEEKDKVEEEEKKEEENNSLKFKTKKTYVKHIENFQNEYAQLYMQRHNKEPNKEKNKILKDVKNIKNLTELDEKYHKLKLKIDELKEKISKSSKK